MRRSHIIICALLGTPLLLFLIFYFGFVTHVDAHEMGFTFNRWTGEIKEVDKKGWVVRNPVVYGVHTIDLRPFQITITADLAVSERILNAKLVQFNPDGLNEFVAWHGRNGGKTRTRFVEIMKCYAFAVDGGESCPFITVSQHVEPGQVGIPVDKSPSAQENKR